MNLLTDSPPQELLLPVEDARTVLKGWLEFQIHEKLVDLYRFSLKSNKIIANCIYSEANDEIDMFFCACSELHLPIRKSEIRGANNYLARSVNEEPKINNICVEEMLAILILKETFSGNLKVAYKGAYHLTRLKFKRSKTLEKYLESTGTRRDRGAKKGGINSGKIRKIKSAFMHGLIVVVINDIAERNEPKKIVALVERQLIKIQKDKHISQRTIRNIIHSHPSLKHISPLIRRK